MQEVPPHSALFAPLGDLLEQQGQQHEGEALEEVVGVDVGDGVEHEHLLGTPLVKRAPQLVELVVFGQSGDVGQEVLSEVWFDFELIEEL